MSHDIVISDVSQSMHDARSVVEEFARINKFYCPFNAKDSSSRFMQVNFTKERDAEKFIVLEEKWKDKHGWRIAWKCKIRQEDHIRNKIVVLTFSYLLTKMFESQSTK